MVWVNHIVVTTLRLSHRGCHQPLSGTRKLVPEPRIKEGCKSRQSLNLQEESQRVLPSLSHLSEPVHHHASCMIGCGQDEEEEEEEEDRDI